MASRLYTLLVTIGNITIYQVSVDPSGILIASRGSIAIRSDSGNEAIYQNTDGASAWSVVGGGGATNVFTDGSTFASVSAGSDGSIVIAGSGTSSPASIPGGTVRTTSTGEGYGIIAGGNLRAAAGTAIIEASNSGVAFGFASAEYGTGTSRILGYGRGSIASGSSTHYGSGDSEIVARFGSIAIGGAGNNAGYTSGIFASNYAVCFGSAYSSTGDTIIQSTGLGTISCGYVYGIGEIFSSGSGSQAMGYVNLADASILSSGAGAKAWGAIQSSSPYDIIAGGVGSTAFGRPNGAAIIASAVGSAQFGSGTNSLAHSFRFGTGLRILTQGTGSANYDLWTAGGNIYVRSGGATRNLSNIP